jgi:hypothetical protein
MGVNRPPASTYVFINKRLALAQIVRYSLSVPSRVYATGNTAPVGAVGKAVAAPWIKEHHFESRLPHATGTDY